MTERPFITTLIAGLLISLIGLSSIILGIVSITSSEPAINIGTVVFGLLLINAGIVCIIGGIGHIFFREWASKLALCGAIAIIIACLAGALHLGGFAIGIGYAVLIMIAAMGVMWYLSKRELGAFFLLSVAEHLIVVLIVIMLIYSGPINAVPEDAGVAVTIEEIKKEPDPPLIKIVPPKKKAKQENKVAQENKKKEPNEPVVPPKLKIRNTTDLDSGSQTMASMPKLPKTFANVTDNVAGHDQILRSPSPEKGIKRTQEIVPTMDNSVGTAYKGPRKAEFTGVVPTFDGGKGKGGKTVGNEPKYNPGNSSFPVGTSDSPGATKPGFIGDIRGEVAGRKVIFWPKLPEEVKGTEGGSATLEITVGSAGNVTKVNIVKKSGNNKLDRIAMSYVKQIRFEELPKNVQQKDQRGEIIINFELAK
ncbi:MAG: Energy transducer TonB [Candidatus Poribacteria bacterium]|nr:Energy transducer TonB [Candidatus Poribacteria bacterium]